MCDLMRRRNAELTPYITKGEELGRDIINLNDLASKMTGGSKVR